MLFQKTSLANALNEYEKYMILKGNATKTISKFKTIEKKSLKSFLCDSDVNVLDDDTKVMLFFSEIKKSAPNSLRIYKKSLNPFITFCIRKKYLRRNPLSHIQFLKHHELPKQIPSDSEAKLIFDNINNSVIKEIAIICMAQGLRRSEAISLRRSDVNIPHRILRIGSERFQTKAKKVRELPITLAAFDILSMRVKQSNCPNNYLFSKENVFPYDPSYVFRRARKISGINKNITIHSLLRYFGTMLMEQDVSIFC